MQFSHQSVEEKPYDACINCAFIGKKCDGPNFLSMNTEQWCEWARRRKTFLGWSNAKVVELSGISKNTVERIMAGTITGLHVDTMRDITKILVNGTWGQYPCAMASDDGVAAELENMRLKEQISFLRDQIDFREKQMLNKDTLLDERLDFIHEKDKAIRRSQKAVTTLCALLGLCLLSIIVALVIDKLNPDIGFFWLNK